MYNRAIIVGRFQPPHLGHLELIKFSLKQAKEIIIVVAAAQISHTIKNPLTAGERVYLLRKMLDNQKIDPNKYYIIPAQDTMDNALWVHHLKRLVPPFDVFIGNNPFTILLFKESGYPNIQSPLYDRDNNSSTQIRKSVLNGIPLGHVLDSEVERILDELNFKDRLKTIVASDETKDDGKLEQGGSELGKNT